MKFRLKFRNKPTTRVSRSSLHSQTPSSKYYHQKNVTTIESWNELRKIGYEAKKPRQLDNAQQGAETAFTLQEVQDWDFYIAEFNKQYRRQLKQPDTERDKDSISTIAETKAQLLNSRQRRMLVYRKCFILSCFLLWGISFFGAHEWYLTYQIYPTGFLQATSNSIFTRYFTPSAVWYAFLLNAHSWFVGCFGFLCAFCFREKPQLLKQFILRVPYMLAIPICLIWIAVRFIGSFSSKKLEDAMNTKIPEYHNFDNDDGRRILNMLEANTNGRRLWDQIQKILQCCGVHGATDWDSVDTDLSDDKSYWPVTCCPKTFVRRAWTKERPNRDDCYHKINKQENSDEYEWAYPYGCLNMAYEFFVKRGAFIVGLMVANFCALCLCLVFAFKYYVMIRKSEEISFKYSMKGWLAEVFFVNKFWWIKPCCKKLLFCKRFHKSKNTFRRQTDKSFASSSQRSRVSGESAYLIPENRRKLRSNVSRIPSVIITAPVKEPDVEQDDADNHSLKVLFSEPDGFSESVPLLSVISEIETKKENDDDDDSDNVISKPVKYE